VLRKNGKRLQVLPHKLFHHLDSLSSWRRGEYFPPIQTEVGPTYRCNQRCRWCYTSYLRDRKHLELDRDTFMKIMKDLGSAGVSSCVLQGCGEPFVNRHTPEAIVTGKASGMDMAVITNGVLFTEEKALECLPHLSWMRFSALEADARMYAHAHGCPEAQYHRLLQNIQAAARLKNTAGHPELVLSTMMVVLDYNWETVPAVTNLARELGLDYIMIRPASSSTRNNFQWEPDIHKKHADIIAEAKEFEREDFLVSIRWDAFEGENRKSFPKEFQKCYGVEFETLIDSDACVYPCLHFWGSDDYKIGDLREATFEEIWRSERKAEVFQKLWTEHDLESCRQICKQSYINGALWEMEDEPLHRNFL